VSRENRVAFFGNLFPDDWWICGGVSVENFVQVFFRETPAEMGGGAVECRVIQVLRWQFGHDGGSFFPVLLFYY
jgi:hypothetical protein